MPKRSENVSIASKYTTHQLRQGNLDETMKSLQQDLADYARCTKNRAVLRVVKAVMQKNQSSLALKMNMMMPAFCVANMERYYVVKDARR